MIVLFFSGRCGLRAQVQKRHQETPHVGWMDLLGLSELQLRNIPLLSRHEQRGIYRLREMNISRGALAGYLIQTK